jgi:hypothetical protein
MTQGIIVALAVTFVFGSSAALAQNALSDRDAAHGMKSEQDNAKSTKDDDARRRMYVEERKEGRGEGTDVRK